MEKNLINLLENLKKLKNLWQLYAQKEDKNKITIKTPSNSLTSVQETKKCKNIYANLNKFLILY